MTSFTTRHLKVCFEVEAQVLPLPEDETAQRPEILILQQALIDHPELLNQALAYYALDAVCEHLQEMPGLDSWMPACPDADLLDAIRGVALPHLRPLLYERLVQNSTEDELESLFVDGFEARLTSQAQVTDLENGQEINWSARPESLFQRIDERHRFLLAEVQGETVLCLNLVGFDPDDVIDAAAYELEAGYQRILVFLSAADFSPEEQDDLAVRLVETFGELPVEIYTGPQFMI